MISGKLLKIESNFLQQFKDQVPPQFYKTWFTNILPMSLTDKGLVLVDLIILNTNPLEGIFNTQNKFRVILNGEIITEEK